MKTQQPFFFHHILSQDVVEIFQKIVQEGYCLRQIQAHSPNGNYSLTLYGQSPSNARQLERCDPAVSAQQAFFVFHKSGWKTKEAILLQCNMVRPEAPLPHNIPEFMKLYYHPLSIEKPIHLTSNSELELDRRIVSTLEEACKITTGINIPVSSKISSIEVLGFKRQGIIKAVVDPEDVEDEEIPSHEVDLDVDAILVFEMPDIKTKLYISPPFSIRFWQIDEPYIAGELYPYQMPYISRYKFSELG